MGDESGKDLERGKSAVMHELFEASDVDVTVAKPGGEILLTSSKH